MRVILQRSFKDCGVACLAMLCNHYGHTIEYSDIASRIPVSSRASGLSLGALQCISKTLGFQALAFKCSLQKAKSVGFPLIAHCNDNHYIVLEANRKGKATVVDPRFGRIRLPIKEFEEMYSGYCIKVRIPSEFRPPTSNPHFGSGAWEAKFRTLALKSFSVIGTVGFLHVASTACLVVLARSYFGTSHNSTFWIISLSLGFESMVLPSITEPIVISTCSRMIRELAILSSRESALLLEVQGGYRIEERIRWIAEHTYQNRWTALSICKLFWGLFLLSTVALIVRDWKLLSFTIAFILAAGWEGRKRIMSIDLSPADHSARRFISGTIDKHLGGRIQRHITNIEARTYSDLLRGSIGAFIVTSMFLFYWGGSSQLFSATSIMILVSQMKLFEWWFSGQHWFTAWVVMAHSYSHLSFMSLLQRVQASSEAATIQGPKN